MTTLDLPLAPTRSRSGSRPGSLGRPGGNNSRPDQLVTDTLGVGADTTTDLRFDVLSTNLETDTGYSYALDGFTPGSVDKCGCSDPEDDIDLEGLAEHIFTLLRREAYIERERLGARR